MQSYLIIDRNERMMRRERSRRTFTMKAQRFLFAVDDMFFEFGNVMRNVVD